MKYIALTACPIFSYGGSTGLAPIHVKATNTLTSLQIFIFFVGLNFVFFVFLITNTIRIAMDEASATTPPSFDGIDRKIA